MIAKNYKKTLLVVGILLFMNQVSLAASFRFSPTTNTLTNNCEYTAEIIINPESKVSNAAETEITFDPSIINVIDSDPSFNGIQIEQGDAFSSFLENQVNNTDGKIRLTAASFTNTLQTEKTFGRIHFKIVKYSSSPTQFLFNFSGIGKTLDSNIAEAQTGKDILSSVQNATYTITSNGDCNVDVLPPTINNPQIQQNQITLNIQDDKSGVDINTVQLIIGDSIYNLKSLVSNITGSDNNYTLKITLPINYNTNAIIAVIVGDKTGNTTLKNLAAGNQPTPITTICESDNTTKDSDAITKYVPSQILLTLASLNFSVLPGIGAFSVISLLLLLFVIFQLAMLLFGRIKNQTPPLLIIKDIKSLIIISLIAIIIGLI
jgi:hypothetical protein